MNVPCKIKAQRHVKYGSGLEMSQGATADVTLEAEKATNRYRTLKVSTTNSFELFTEEALKNAIARGDFSLD